MLQNLSIQNYALIERLEIAFSNGFTVITGETGAGKSILLGALGLLIGKRADPNVLMDKQNKCIVEGSFDIGNLGLRDYFIANDLDFETISILRREIIPSGRSRAFVNDTPVNLDVLKKLGERLLDIHSQHQTLMLNNVQFQLEVLDGFINQPNLLQNYRVSFKKYESNRRQLEQLIHKNTEAKKDEDYIRFQYNELESANLNAEATDELIEKEKFLTHAEEVITEISHANQILSEDDLSVTSQINKTVSGLQRIAKFFQPVKQLLERLDNLQIEIKDIATEIEYALNGITFNPNELEEITSKLDNVYRLQQKYGLKSVDSLIELRDNFAEKLENSISLKEEIEALSEKNVLFKKDIEKLAGQLHDNRKMHARLFEQSIIKVLIQLGMIDAALTINVNKQETYSEHGFDEILFLFNANKGGTPNEISKIASGGELSRLMLAIKSLVSKENFLPTVIFDEIDAGVSGEIAGKVGNILNNMSKSHQLIAISHLPQIASKANTHLLVSKHDDNGQTHSQINLLDHAGRVDEIAKMMSNEKVSQSAIATAKELLKQV